ncbi:MAG: 2-(1,2-epoxy,2-dihydrophenyl)acetyl-CoA isomerase [Candidatus Acidoferrum typicum]|nr:2-(1,2-epoxy,2-dihydrophenyl)acetyl-CoA isomerase [Candidatus Acidoferrum typicum]
MSTSAQAGHENGAVLEKREGRVATLIFNRPERMNALNADLVLALNDALTRVEADPEINVVVLAGAGRAFCAGGDLAVIGKGRQENNIIELQPILRAGMQVVLKIRTMRQPVIAAVHGAAAGAGMNIALASDIRVAAEDAMFGQNFAKVGLFPDYGGTFFLPQLVGPAKAAELFYTGEMIDAAEALRIGIVNRVVPLAQLETEAHTLARKIAHGPAIAIRAIKETLFGRDKEELAKLLNLEVEQQMKCFYSEDCGEGIRAFFEKRAPKFQGK